METGIQPKGISMATGRTAITAPFLLQNLPSTGVRVRLFWRAASRRACPSSCAFPSEARAPP